VVIQRSKHFDAGAHHVIVTDSGDLVKEVMAATGGKGADLILMLSLGHCF
jgi:NADPH:quinone reductase-like Zn-dependent oxidoreductase